MLIIMNSGAISCATEVLGADGIARAGDKLVIEVVIDAARSALCPTFGCTPRIVGFIRSRILSRLSSVLFTLNVALNGGTVMPITVRFCLFGSGKTYKP